MANILVSLIVGIIISLYIPCVWIPSITINGFIVFVCIFKKELHTSINIITGHISFLGLLMSAVYSTANIIDFCLAMTLCNCRLTYVTWVIAHVIHLSVYPLNGLLLAIIYFCILVFSWKKISAKKIVAFLTFIWIISILGVVPSLYVLPYKEFVSCCENVCVNNTFICNVEREIQFVPDNLNQGIIDYSAARDAFFNIIPIPLIFVFTTISYVIYRKKSLSSTSPSLVECRMLLLPILLSGAFILLYFERNTSNRAGLPSLDKPFPGTTLYFVLTILDFTSLACAGIVLYFNVSMRQMCLKMFKKLCTKNNRINPSNDVNDTSF